MEDLAAPVIALILGLLLGYLIGKRVSSGLKEAPEIASWWSLRKSLTGTQLQILQHMEGHPSISIAELQQKFSFIPDRELYYRLEQIALMGFVRRERSGPDMCYVLDADYNKTVEDDSTVLLN